MVHHVHLFKKALTSIFFSGVLFAGCIFPFEVKAELKFKKKIIENCDEALIEFNQQTKEEQYRNISDLKLILELDFAKLSSDNIKLQGAQSNPSFDVNTDDIWKTFQPNREIKAKKCALQMLSSLAPNAIEAAPQLITLSVNKTLPLEMIEQLNFMIQSISLSAAKSPNYTIPASVFENLIGMLNEQNKTKIFNVLIELRESSIPYLLETIKKPDASNRDNVVEALLRLDEKGEKISQGFVKLLDSADDGLKKRAINLLPQFENAYPFSVPALINKLNDLSPDVVKSVLASLKIIFGKKELHSRIVLEKDTFETLVRAFEASSDEDRGILAEGLMKYARLVEGSQTRLIKSYAIENPSIKADVIRLLAETGSLSSDANAIMISSLKSEDLQVKLAAIATLPYQKNSKLIIEYYLGILKNIDKQHSPEVRQLIILEIAKGLNKISSSPLSAKLLPSLIKAVPPITFTPKSLKLDESLDNALSFKTISDAFVHVGARESVPLLLKSLQASKDASFRQKIIYIISLFQSPDQKTIDALVKVLGEQSKVNRTMTEIVLKEFGKSAVPALEKTLKSNNKVASYSAAKILISMGHSNQNASKIINQNITKDSCIEKSRVVLQVSNAKIFENTNLTETLIKCLEDDLANSEEVSKAIVALAPLTVQNRNLLLQTAKNNLVSKKVQVQLLESAIKLGFTEPEIVSIVTEGLSTSDKALKLRLINILSEFAHADGAKDAVTKLTDIVNENDEPLLAHEALETLIKVDDKAFDYVSFLVKEMNDDEYQWAAKVIGKLKPEMAIPLLAKAIKENDLDKRQRSISVLGNFSDKGKELIPLVLENLEEPDAELRYAACLALIKMDPANPAANYAAKKILVSDVSERLEKERFPAISKSVFDSILKSTESLAEKRIIDKIQFDS